MRLLIYCRRETQTADVEEEVAALCRYAKERGDWISSVLIELDGGVFLHRVGVYEILRQLQQGAVEGLLLSGLAALGETTCLQEEILRLLAKYPVLVAPQTWTADSLPK